MPVGFSETVTCGAMCAASKVMARPVICDMRSSAISISLRRSRGPAASFAARTSSDDLQQAQEDRGDADHEAA